MKYLWIPIIVTTLIVAYFVLKDLRKKAGPSASTLHAFPQYPEWDEPFTEKGSSVPDEGLIPNRNEEPPAPMYEEYKPEAKGFFPSNKWAGRKEGFVFKMGEKGLGYYKDRKKVRFSETNQVYLL